MSVQTSYAVVIDTNQYSGNFERELTGYVTGVYGECEVGSKEAKIFDEDVEDKELAEELGSIVVSRPDDRGCYRPCAITTTPLRRNNGVGVHYSVDSDDDVSGYPAYESVEIYFSEEPTKEMLQLIMDRANAFIKYWGARHYSDGNLEMHRLRVIATETRVEETQILEIDFE